MKRNVIFGTMLSAAFAVSLAAQTGSGAQSGQQGARADNQQNQQVTVTGCLQDASLAGGGAAAGTSGSATTGSGTTGSGTTGSGSTAGTQAGQSGSSASREGQFILTNATVTTGTTSGAGTAAGTGTTGTGTSGTGTAGTPTTANPSATAGAGADMNKFVLVGGNQQELRRYLNSQVEIRGRIDRGMGGAADRTSGAGTAAGTGTATGTGTGSGTAASGTAASGQSAKSSADQHGQRLHVNSVKQISPNCQNR